MSFSINELRILISQSGYQELIITIICVVGIVIALANCFAGYRLLPIWLVLLGAMLGAVCAYAVCTYFSATVIVQAIAILISALVFALLAYHFKTIGSFLLCTGMTFSVSYYFLLFILGYGDIKGNTITAAVISILCGLLAHLVKKPAIILITACCGAYTAFSTTCSLFQIFFSLRLYWILIGILTAIGTIAQFVAAPSKSSKKSKR